MAAMDNENNIQTAPADSFNLVDAAETTNQQPGQILLVGPGGLVSPATIDEGGVVRELQTTTSTTPNTADISGSDDILQQAFQEAGNDFPEEGVSMQNPMETEEEVATNEGDEGGSISYLTTEDGQIVNSIIESTFTGEDGNQYAVIKSTEDGSQQIIMTSQGNEEGIAMPDEMQLQGEEQPEYFDVEQPLQVQEMVNGDPNPAIIYTDGQDPQPQEIVDEITKPLGSSDNPIRIIQQGNQYTSLQQLTPEQLQHIMQVLQQQQLVKPYQKQGTTTLYSPGTNTKIVYRVVYPGDKKGVLVTAGVGRGRGRGRGRGKVIAGQRGRGRPRKIPLNDEEIDPSQFPELSKEEKEKKKKMRPRTRSGRVSKPPKHMIKDYKQIHLVDWAEDYDDSDGGYSDFHPSDDEREGDEEDNESFTGMEEDVDSGYGTVAKARNHKCPACGKCYIGQRSLNRHYRLHPDHGTPVPDVRDPVRSMNEDSNSSGASAVKPSKAMCTFRRGKLPQRLRSLREVVTHFSNEELMEIVLPRLTQCVSTWEFLLMKSERPEPGGSAMRPSIPEMLREYESLLKDVRQYGSQRVRETETAEPHDKDSAVRISDPLAAASLGLRPSVWYEVQPDSQPYIPMKFKYSKAASDFKDRMDDFGIGVAEGSAEPPKKRVRIAESAVNGRVPGVDRTPHVRSLLTEKRYTPEQTINFSPGSVAKGQGQVHGRIRLDRASGNSKSEPTSVQSVSDNDNMTLKVSDLISARARDENELVMDTGAEVSDVTHSPEAMLQTTGRVEELNTAESKKQSAQISEQFADAEINAQESNHQIDTTVTMGVTPTPPPVTSTADNSVATDTPESSLAPNQPPPEVTSLPEVDQQAGGDAANSAEDPNSAGNIVIMQTEDGMLVIQKPDGSTIQVQHGGGELSMETVQYLLSMDASQLAEQNPPGASVEEPISITEGTSQ